MRLQDYNAVLNELNEIEKRLCRCVTYCECSIHEEFKELRLKLKSLLEYVC